MVMRLTAIFVCVILAASTSPAWAAVYAQLSAQNIDELETVRLTIRITETSETQALDLSALERDFHVMGTQNVSQTRYLNGRGQSWVDYQITLRPKRAGTLTIPSITVGREQTPSLELTVLPLSDQTRRMIEELVFFESEVSSGTIYVQSQLILTRRLLYSQGVQLYSNLPGPPEIADAVVLTLGETVSGDTERNDRRYGVVEQRYAIFPESSGELVVPGISITASVRLVEDNRVSRKGVRVSTDDETINVLPVPANYPADKPWLPAEDVALMEVISPAVGEHDVGDTLTHELLVHMRGNIGSISPPLPLLLDDSEFRSYPQAPVIEDDTSTSTVKGSRLQTTSIVPLKPGDMSLPVTELFWWDTINDELRVSRTQPQSIKVTGQAVTQLQPSPAQVVEAASAGQAPDARAWPSISFATLAPYLNLLAVLTVLCLLAWLAYRSRHYWAKLGTLRSNAYRNLQAAFGSLDRVRVHAALTAYLATLYRCPRHAALARFASLDPQTAEALQRLEQALYADDTDNTGRSPDFKADVKTLRAAVRRLRVHPARAAQDPLPALYPAST